MNKNVTTIRLDGRQVTIRPICSTDVTMEEEFVRHLSSETKRFRFFCAISELSDAEAHQLCEVDGRRSMAFVATIQQGEREVEIGICRYAPATKSDVREMAVTIADEWQHTKLARLLLERLIASAKQFGIRELYAVELCDNHKMHDFAREIGMTTRHDSGDATQVIYSMSI